MGIANANLLSALKDLEIQFDILSDKDLLLNPKNLIINESYLRSAVLLRRNVVKYINLLNEYSNVLLVGWHTKITSFVLKLIPELDCKLHFYSHGVSLNNFEKNLKGFIRSVMRLPEKMILNKTLNRFESCIFLSKDACGERNLDLRLYKDQNKPIYTLPNYSDRRPDGRNTQQITYDLVCIGYFSEIKNQYNLIKEVISADINLKILFIGPKRGKYYFKCVKEAEKNEKKFIFYDDSEMSVVDALSKSKALISFSNTEVLPITFIEAINFNKPIFAKFIPDLQHLKFVKFISSVKEVDLSDLHMTPDYSKFKKEYNKDMYLKSLQSWYRQEIL